MQCCGKSDLVRYPGQESAEGRAMYETRRITEQGGKSKEKADTRIKFPAQAGTPGADRSGIRSDSEQRGRKGHKAGAVGGRGGAFQTEGGGRSSSGRGWHRARADTVVCQDGQIMGKPKDEADAKQMLQKLQGEEHSVYTGVTILVKENGAVQHVQTFSPGDKGICL